MKIKIENEIFEVFPNAKIGWLLAEVKVVPSNEYVESMKKSLTGRLKDIGISQDTMMLHPDVAGWREVYSKMGVKPSKYRSSLESLLRRAFKGEMWSVSSVVDCYDCVSAINLLPMGAHDIEKLKGGLVLRFGREGEKFYPLGAGDSVIDVDTRNVLYADEEKVCCWLWNHRDTRDASLSESTKEALFLVDQAFDTEWKTVREGLDSLSTELEKIGCKTINSGIVNSRSTSSVII
ncbi:MAG: phenylalanine--tRNA ligase beta subunit-related protein [Synergistaceae bacterium]|jgi:lysyl-tRNA synthetase class 2|nr:phenylalanine--tRNA ligase beta subunit-related protein [Synergistaceae bacterium]